MARWVCKNCGGRTFIVLMQWVPALVSGRRELIEFEPAGSAPCLDSEVMECALQGPGVRCQTCGEDYLAFDTCGVDAIEYERFWQHHGEKPHAIRCGRKAGHRPPHVELTASGRGRRWCEIADRRADHPDTSKEA